VPKWADRASGPILAGFLICPAAPDKRRSRAFSWLKRPDEQGGSLGCSGLIYWDKKEVALGANSVYLSGVSKVCQLLQVSTRNHFSGKII
jgi:hypothetical protein